MAAHDTLFRSPFDLRVASYDGLPHERLLRLAIQRISSLNLTPRKFLYLLNHYGKSLDTDIMLRHLVSDLPVLNDEGLCKNFSSEMLAFSKESPELLNDMLRRHAIVHCDGSPPEMIRRIRHRQKHGLLTPIYQSASDGEISDIVTAQLNQAEQLANLLHSEGIPVLRIDMDQPLHVSVRMLQDFIRSHTK